MDRRLQQDKWNRFCDKMDTSCIMRAVSYCDPIRHLVWANL